jgi:hypothetical protein
MTVLTALISELRRGNHQAQHFQRKTLGTTTPRNRNYNSTTPNSAPKHLLGEAENVKWPPEAAADIPDAPPILTPKGKRPARNLQQSLPAIGSTTKDQTTTRRTTTVGTVTRKRINV